MRKTFGRLLVKAMLAWYSLNVANTNGCVHAYGFRLAIFGERAACAFVAVAVNGVPADNADPLTPGRRLPRKAVRCQRQEASQYLNSDGSRTAPRAPGLPGSAVSLGVWGSTTVVPAPMSAGPLLLVCPSPSVAPHAAPPAVTGLSKAERRDARAAAIRPLRRGHHLLALQSRRPPRLSFCAGRLNTCSNGPTVSQFAHSPGHAVGRSLGSVTQTRSSGAPQHRSISCANRGLGKDHRPPYSPYHLFLSTSCRLGD
jgi:hypothetical protein